MKTLFVLLGLFSFAVCYHKLHFFDKPWRPPKHSGSLIRLYSDDKSELYGKISLQGKTFKVFFDLQFDKLAVLSSKCLSLSCAWGHQRYDGPSVENATDVEFTVLGHKVFGELTEKDVTVGDVLLLEADFYQVINETAAAISRSYDGVFGLSNYEGSFMDKMSVHVTAPTVSISLKKEGGYVIFGGAPKDVKMDAIPIHQKKNDPTKWTMKLSFVESKDKGFKYWCGTGCSVELSSTEEGIVGPKADVTSVHRYIGAVKSGNDYTVNCDTIENLPTLTFHIHGNPYSIQGHHYTKKVTTMYGETKCVTLLQESVNNFSHWVLGRAFLNQYVLILNYFPGSDRSVSLTQVKEFNMYSKLKMPHL